MENYFAIFTKEELDCLKYALSIAYLELNNSAKHDCKWEGNIMRDVYKKEAIKIEKLLYKLNYFN